MDQDFKFNPNLDIFSLGQILSKKFNNENDDNDNNQYDFGNYYTSEIILSPNGVISISFKKSFKDFKFKIKEGNNIFDLLLSWEDRETVNKKVSSKFEVDYYSDGIF